MFWKAHNYCQREISYIMREAREVAHLQLHAERHRAADFEITGHQFDTLDIDKKKRYGTFTVYP